MSSKQDLIEIKEVISQCNELIKQQSQGWAKIVEEIKKVNSSAPSSYIKMQREVAKSIVDAEKAEQQYQKTLQQKQVLEQKILQTEKQKIQLAETARRANEAQSKSKEKELATEAKLQAQLEKSQNTYNRVQQKVNETTQAYNNLATKKQLGVDLNDKEQRTLALLEARLNKYNGILKTVDANIGKNQRNVGNYASGWNGLSNSINQITREMPAFAVSMNTGFLALSNNIPILFDEIQRVNNEVKNLRAQGKPTESVLTRLASSFFSLQTAMSLGVTLLTLYGADIIKWASKLIQGKESVDKFTESSKALSKAFEDGDYKEVIKDVSKVKIAFEQASNGVITNEKALKTYNETLGDSLGKAKNLQEAQELFVKKSERYVEATIKMAVFNNILSKSAELASKRMELLSETQITTAERWEAIWDLMNISGKDALRTIQKNGLANAVYITALDNRAKKAKEVKEEEDALFDIATNAYAEYQKLAKGINIDGFKDGKKEDINKTLEEALKYRYEEQKTALELQMARAKDLNDLDDYYNAKFELIFLDNKYNIESAKLQIKNKENLNRHLETIENELKIAIIEYYAEETKAYQDADEAKKKVVAERIKREQDAWKKILEFANKARKEEYDLNDLDNQILLAQAKNEDEAFEIKEKQLEDWWKYQLDTTKEGSNERLKAEKEFQLKSIQLEVERQAKLKALQDNTKKILKETALNVLGGLGGDSLAQFFNGEFEAIWKGAETTAEKVAIAMKAIGEISMAVMGQISAMQQANFEAQLSRLNTEKEVALQFAGDSASGREAIEQQYEAKRKDIQKRQAIAEKKMAIMQIAINTAVGITAALSQGPTGIPLSIVIGALGAIQAGIVASTPIPEFWTGTENAPEGLALTQERGAEIIMDKNNRIKTLGNDKGAQLTYLNKGDKVLNASDTTDKINEMLMGSGISPIVKVENKGLTEQQLRNALNDTLARQPKQMTKFDEKGVTLFIERENSRTIKRGNNARI